MIQPQIHLTPQGHSGKMIITLRCIKLPPDIDHWRGYWCPYPTRVPKYESPKLALGSSCDFNISDSDALGAFSVLITLPQVGKNLIWVTTKFLKDTVRGWNPTVLSPEYLDFYYNALALPDGYKVLVDQGDPPRVLSAIREMPGFITLEQGVGYVFDWATGVVSSEIVVPEEPTFKCPYCPLAFYTQEDLDRHIASQHALVLSELVVAYALWDKEWNEIVTRPSWEEISFTNTWPANTKVTTRWRVKNTRSEGAFFKVRLLGLPEAILKLPLESVAVWLDPNKEAELYLYPITPGPEWENYGYILDVLVKLGEVYYKTKTYTVGIKMELEPVEEVLVGWLQTTTRSVSIKVRKVEEVLVGWLQTTTRSVSIKAAKVVEVPTGWLQTTTRSVSIKAAKVVEVPAEEKKFPVGAALLLGGGAALVLAATKRKGKST